MEILELKKQITSGIIKSTYLFTGDEQYLIRTYTNMISDRLLDASSKTLNYEVMEECNDIDKILNSCVSLPMFSNNKIVVVKNSGLFQKKKEDLVELIEYVNKPCESTCLIFWESKIDKRNALYKAVNNNGIFFEFEYRNPDELIKWVQSVVKKDGKTIDHEAAVRLTFNVDNGLFELENELNKLLMFCKDRPAITLNDVNEACVRSVKAGIFDLTDAVVSGQTGVAYKKLYDLFYLKEPPFMIFFMIARQFMMLNDMLNMKTRGLTLKEISSKVKTPDFITRKNMANAEKYNKTDLKSAVKLLNKIDMDIKSGRITVEAGLDILIPSLSDKKFDVILV